ncbi:MAG: hypothetical protein K5873_01950, partial [Treponema sp.]|nr:hypothetical protein [Treponema sp.]
LEDNFAPPDPTPADAVPPQSFNYGGAVPPEQTAASAPSQANSSSDFREMAIKEISMKDPMLASSLFQTGPWIKNGNTISTSVKSSYVKMQLDNHRGKISQFLSGLYNCPLQFEISLRQEVKVPVEVNAPNQVNILCDMFKGEIVGHSKKTDQEIAAEASQKAQEKAQTSHNEDSSDEEEDNE